MLSNITNIEHFNISSTTNEIKPLLRNQPIMLASVTYYAAQVSIENQFNMERVQKTVSTQEKKEYREVCTVCGDCWGGGHIIIVLQIYIVNRRNPTHHLWYIQEYIYKNYEFMMYAQILLHTQPAHRNRNRFIYVHTVCVHMWGLKPVWDE